MWRYIQILSLSLVCLSTGVEAWPEEDSEHHKRPIGTFSGHSGPRITALGDTESEGLLGMVEDFLALVGFVIAYHSGVWSESKGSSQ